MKDIDQVFRYVNETTLRGVMMQLGAVRMELKSSGESLHCSMSINLSNGP